ncbi:MAG: hypothetical protein K2M10_05490 [Muribaculaceae bacterium]|nr:hypothetical protein [Muribaculaceae bacterium]MDE5975175.1 hypothetical protein [Muribaculaceae bacterium]MDE6299081.1 hypothetical protein [Muribaculaceae bacterium]
MALYRITTRKSFNGGMRGSIDAGMSIEMSSFTPVMVVGPYAEKINQLFLNKYGVNLKEINALSPVFLSVTRIS